MSRRIVVFGGSGGVGRHVVSGAIARGWSVTALVREGTPLDAPPAARIVRGDVLDPAALGSLFDHAREDGPIDAVVSSLGVKRRVPANPYSAATSPPGFCARSAELICAAAKSAGIPRLIAVSAAGVAESAAAMNLVMRVLVATSTIGVAYRDLAEMEQVYARSGVDWLCPRPVTLTDRADTGEVRVVDRFGATMTISRSAVARWALDRVESGFDVDAHGRTPQIAA